MTHAAPARGTELASPALASTLKGRIPELRGPAVRGQQRTMKNEQPARFDDSAWPLLVVQLPPLLNNMTAIGSIIDGFDRAYRRSAPFASVTDASLVARFPGTLERKALLDWVGSEARIETARGLSIATGLVLPSGPMRAFMSAINWVRRPTTPQRVTSSLEEAIEWCGERLQEAGLTSPAAFAALRARRASSVPPARGAR
jgi:hypothetical protein